MIKKLLLSFVLPFCCAFSFHKPQPPITELKLMHVSQLTQSYAGRFDLSGMAKINNKIYVIADKESNRYIYEIAFNKKNWLIKKQVPLDIAGIIDFEAIDACYDCFYVANEFDNQVYKVGKQGKTEKVPVDFAGAGISLQEWKKNTGLESLALDCKNKVLYLAKEREPRYIMKIDLVSGKILDQFNVPESESNDFADMKFENGYLYLLERNGSYVTKVNPNTHTVVAKVSYKTTSSAPEGKLYEPSEFGMEEGLLLTKEEIWLGLDNNELEVSPYAAQKYKITGTQPVILKFKRPQGF